MPHEDVTLSSTDRIEAFAELRAAVTDLKSGEVSFVEGVRRVLSVRRRIGAPDFDTDFMVLVAVDSQSDHLPVGGAKLFASPAWLQQSTQEERELRRQYETAVWAACDRLIERFARAA